MSDRRAIAMEALKGVRRDAVRASSGRGDARSLMISIGLADPEDEENENMAAGRADHDRVMHEGGSMEPMEAEPPEIFEDDPSLEGMPRHDAPNEEHAANLRGFEARRRRGSTY